MYTLLFYELVLFTYVHFIIILPGYLITYYSGYTGYSGYNMLSDHSDPFNNILSGHSDPLNNVLFTEYS